MYEKQTHDEAKVLWQIWDKQRDDAAHDNIGWWHSLSHSSVLSGVPGCSCLFILLRQSHNKAHRCVVPHGTHRVPSEGGRPV